MNRLEQRFGSWVSWLSVAEQADLLRLTDAEPQERWIEYYRKIARTREYVHRLGLKVLGVRAFAVARASRTRAGDVVIDYLPPAVRVGREPVMAWLPKKPAPVPVPVTEVRRRGGPSRYPLLERQDRERLERMIREYGESALEDVAGLIRAAEEARREPRMAWLPREKPVPVPITEVRTRYRLPVPVVPRGEGKPGVSGAPEIVLVGR